MDQDLEALILANANDEDIEFLILHNILGEERILPAQNQEFDLENMSEADVKTNFRFSKQDIPVLVNALRIPDIIHTDTRNTVTGIMGLCILLRRLAYPSRLKDLQPLFNLSPQSMSQIINHMITFITENHVHLLTDLRNVPWLNEERMETYAEVNN
ncbi:uncharacterized protein LOC126886054 [Diabrotica virgifera virgifera]|uniref:Uncharacterized protein LOC114332436 n=1 Tax=Diabrotica virgifera virgifera TaxID=50390 RepID=A0A6P7FNV0_DIAVI|nr:uncharacterized protein LOC126886054 [Diabrotica virgifera virgifera]